MRKQIIAIFWAVVCVFRVESAAVVEVSSADDVFTAENWEKIPVLTGVESINVLSVLADGGITLNGLKWALNGHKSCEINELLDGAYELELVAGKETFKHAVFEVDAENNLRYQLVIMSKVSVSAVDDGGGSDETPHKVTSFFLSRKLTDEEALNPIIQALRLDKTFEGMRRLLTEDPEAYERDVLSKLMQQMLHFVLPKKRESFTKMVNDEMLRE